MGPRAKRLTSLFAAAAAGLGIGLSATFWNEPAAPPAQPEPAVPTAPVVTTATPSAASLQLWQTILKNDTVDYKPGNAPAAPAEKASHTIAVQLESIGPVMPGLILRGPPGELFIRHGDAAAAIIDQTADRASGKDVEPFFVRMTEHAPPMVGMPDHEYMRAIFDNADVICLSMGRFEPGSQEDVLSAGDLVRSSQIQIADDFWADTKAILVVSAGNWGEQVAELERRSADSTMRADTMLVVGEASQDENGDFIAAHSSKAGVSVVTENPFMKDFSYPVIRDEKNLREYLDKMFDTTVPGTPFKAKEAFERALKSWRGNFNPLRAANPEFEDADFPGKDFLLKPWREQVAAPEEARKAFIETLVSSLSMRLDEMDAGSGSEHDADGNTRKWPGTSFTAPYVAGMVAGGRESHPELSPLDLNAAALLAADPEAVMRAKNVVVDPHAIFLFGPPPAQMISVEYPNNGRNLPFDSYRGGFGLLTEEGYNKTLADMAALLKANPALATVPQKADTGLTVFAPVAVADGQKTIDYKIEMTDDIVALRSNLALHFTGGPAHAPVEITLINPAGGEVKLSPTKLADSDPFSFSLGTTDGHFGNYTKGTWTIRVPADRPLDSAKLTVQGSQRGGLIDILLKQEVDGTNPVTKRDLPKPAPQPQPELPPFNLDDLDLEGANETLDIPETAPVISDEDILKLVTPVLTPTPAPAVPPPPPLPTPIP